MIQFSSVQSLSCVQLFAAPWTTVRQASLSITNSWSSPKPMSIELVMPSNHLILCRPFFLLPSILPSIRVFSNPGISLYDMCFFPTPQMFLQFSVKTDQALHILTHFCCYLPGDVSDTTGYKAAPLPFRHQSQVQVVLLNNWLQMGGSPQVQFIF